MIKSVDC